MGFGTGLNAALAMKTAVDQNVTLTYVGIERDPIAWEIIEQLNIPELIQMDEATAASFEKLHNQQHSELTKGESRFSGKVEFSSMEAFQLPHQPYDVVFYDAFGPGTQAELWDRNITDKLFNMISQRGVLTTFCAQGQFRRNLIASGFEVQRLDGPPGKRQMIRAVKP